MPPAKDSPFRLVVEGRDDLHAITNLLVARGFDPEASGQVSPYVHAAGGLPEVLRSLEPGHKTYVRYGLVVDADAECAQRWSAIGDRLAALGYEVPATAPPGGYIASHSTPTRARVGVWLMPNNRDEGLLEDFLTGLIPDNDSCWQHAQDATVRAMALGAQLPERYAAKGRLHAWLAWQENPGLPLGTAITARFLDPLSERANAFVAWFRELFG